MAFVTSGKPLEAERKSGIRRVADAAMAATLIVNGLGSAGGPFLLAAQDSGGHSQAAPRTPLESPWAGGRSFVSTRSEKIHLPQRRGTSS